MKFLSFDIWGDYGHFRKFYTTTSPLTFPFPPPPTIAGILGAFIGCNKTTNEYLKIFCNEKCKISLKILSPVQKVRIGLNLMDTKGSNLKIPYSDKNCTRTQIRFEMLYFPKFRFFVHHEDQNVFNELCTMVSKHRTVFSISLGLSELLADFAYYGQHEGEFNDSKTDVVVSTPVRMDCIDPDKILFSSDSLYFKERVPLRMNSERVVESYGDILYDPRGCPLKITASNTVKFETGDTIALL